MKKTLLTLALATLSAVASFAQGTITFNTGTLTRARWEDPVSHAMVVVPAGAPLNYGVFWGQAADALVLNDGPIGTAHATTPGAIQAASLYAINGGVPGSTVFMRIAAWTSSFGRDAAAAKGTVGAHYGETAVRSIALGPETGPGTLIWSTSNQTLFQPMQIPIVVPEPSVIALGVLGVGALLLRRKKA
jgi:hypothetical protein